MSQKKTVAEIIVGAILCLGLAGFYGYLIVKNRPKTPEVASSSTSLKLDETTLLDIRTRTLNGTLPITVTPEELGNTQLFRQP